MGPPPYDATLVEGLKFFQLENFETVEKIRGQTFEFSEKAFLESWPEYMNTLNTQFPAPKTIPMELSYSLFSNSKTRLKTIVRLATMSTVATR